MKLLIMKVGHSLTVFPAGFSSNSQTFIKNGYSKFIKLIEACESSFLIDREHLIKKKTKTIKRMCLKNK